MTRVLAFLAVLAAATPALADDEGSEHTAGLLGAAADTVGVTVSFDAKTGWSMDVRPTPGADVVTSRLAIDRRHTHYAVFVAPGRKHITFVLTSAGWQLGLRDPIAWTYSPDGKLVKSQRLSQLLKMDELDNQMTSVGHDTWVDDLKATKDGLQITVKGSKRVLTVN